MAKRLGITTRVALAHYGEARDCLAQDWGAFLAHALPECAWMPLPNLGEGIVEFAERWQLDGVILSGGNDIGTSAVRDATESKLVELARERRWPLFGVCRGLQFLQHLHGGQLAELEGGGHAGTRHALVRCGGDTLPLPSGTVNSFHDQAVLTGTLAAPLVPLAESEDGVVEACRHPKLPWAATMWHPEREETPVLQDVALVRALFRAENS